MKKLLLLTAVVVVGSLAAQAGTVTLTFEGLQNNEQVLPITTAVSAATVAARARITESPLAPTRWQLSRRQRAGSRTATPMESTNWVT